MPPALRRFGLGAMLALLIACSMAPHAAFHGLLDRTQPWCFAPYGLGVAAAVVGCDADPALAAIRRRVPWADVAAVFAVAAVAAAVHGGIDPPYSEDWSPALLFGIGVAALFLDDRVGGAGASRGATCAVRAVLAGRPLRKLGTFSYSIYLMHFAVLRLLVGIAARFHSTPAALGACAFGMFVPAAVALAYAFSVRFERGATNAPVRTACRPAASTLTA